MPAAPEPGLGARGQLLHGEDVDVQPAHQVDHRRGRHQAHAQAHGRDPEPRPAGRRPRARARRGGPSTAAGEDRARAGGEQRRRSGTGRGTATASGSTRRRRGVRGERHRRHQRETPFGAGRAGATAHAAHGSAAAVASRRRRFQAAAIARHGSQVRRPRRGRRRLPAGGPGFRSTHAAQEEAGDDQRAPRGRDASTTSDDGVRRPRPGAGWTGVATVDAPVEHALEAVYLDTADLRLLRARITLRRRTGGADAGWHLKLPAGTARRELHAPLGRASKKPPKALLEPVAGVLRGAQAQPVATLRTRRVVTALRDADGRLLAEVADDTVTRDPPPAPGGAAELQTWREVEVELGRRRRGTGRGGGERLIAAGPGRRPRRPRSAGCSTVGSPRCRPARPRSGGDRGGVGAARSCTPRSATRWRPAGGRRPAAHRAARRRPPGPGGRAPAAQHPGGVPPACWTRRDGAGCATSCRGSAGSSPTPGTPRWRWSTCGRWWRPSPRSWCSDRWPPGSSRRSCGRSAPAWTGPAHAVGTAVPPPARRPARASSPTRRSPRGAGGAAPAGPPRRRPSARSSGCAGG